MDGGKSVNCQWIGGFNRVKMTLEMEVLKKVNHGRGGSCQRVRCLELLFQR